VGFGQLAFREPISRQKIIFPEQTPKESRMVSPRDEKGKKERREMRLTGESRFRFHCYPGVTCFTSCCRDVNIFLSPYDILRMKKGLGVSSEEFLERYTLSLIPETSGLPVVLLKMREDQNRDCPFVRPEGCSIYEDRPWPCRMYPLEQRETDGEFHFLAQPSICLGMKEDREWTVREYLQDQGVGPYNEMQNLLGTISGHPRLSRENIRNPKVQEMCRMALYDLDRFRRFVLESRFLQIFYVEKEIAQKIATDDLELMKLAHRWLEFGLISGETLKMREDLLKGKESSKSPA
jgi:Fe-S-cluster containining protein